MLAVAVGMDVLVESSRVHVSFLTLPRQDSGGEVTRGRGVELPRWGVAEADAVEKMWGSFCAILGWRAAETRERKRERERGMEMLRDDDECPKVKHTRDDNNKEILLCQLRVDPG